MTPICYEIPLHEERAMSARKLSRLAGLVFVLAAVVGGVSTGAFAADEVTAAVMNTLNFEWH
ncbi:hypothetical protein Ait01nite_065490 [Actinoplanes italicus]|nr:hypothetical protein Ait01nite_065490 [Actinoplanes italicus]